MVLQSTRGWEPKPGLRQSVHAQVVAIYTGSCIEEKGSLGRDMVPNSFISTSL